MKEQYLLAYRLQMEVLICQRDGMIALNQFREMRGDAQAYGEEAFLAIATELNHLVDAVRNL